MPSIKEIRDEYLVIRAQLRARSRTLIARFLDTRHACAVPDGIELAEVTRQLDEDASPTDEIARLNKVLARDTVAGGFDTMAMARRLHSCGVRVK